MDVKSKMMASLEHSKKTFTRFTITGLKQTLAFALTLSMIVGGHAPLKNAHAENSDHSGHTPHQNASNDHSPLTLAELDAGDVKVETLDAYIMGESGASHPADYFRVIPQEIPGASWNRSLVYEKHLKSEKENRLQDIKKAFESNPANEDYRDEATGGPRDLYPDELVIAEQIAELKTDSEVKADRRFLRTLKTNDLDIRVYNKNNVFTDYSVASFRGSKKDFNGFPAEISKFEILYRGTVLNKFMIPAESLAVHAEMIFFKEAGSTEISFVDLDYFRQDIGRAPIPVFRMGDMQWAHLNTSSLSRGLFSIRNNHLYIGDLEIEKKSIDFYREFQITSFNATVGLVDPSTHKEVADSVENFKQYWVQGQKLAEKELFVEGFENHPVDGMVDDYFLKLQDQLESNKSLEEFKKREDTKFGAERLEKTLSAWSEHKAYKAKLFSRLSHMWGKLSLSKPQGGSTLKASILMLAAQIRAKNEGATTANIREAMLRIINHRYVKITGTGVAIGAFYYFYPQESLEMVMNAAQTFKNAVTLLFETTKSTFSGFVDVQAVYNSYLSSERRFKFGYGITALIALLGTIVFVPIVVVNSYYYYKALPSYYKDHYTERAKEKSYSEFFKSILEEKKISEIPAVTSRALKDFSDFFSVGWNAFIKEQDKQRKGFVQTQIEADAAKVGLTASKEWTQEQNIEATKIAEGLYAKAFGKDKKTKFKADITTMRQALGNFMFGDSAFNNMQSFSVPLWNFWIGVRTFWIKPHLVPNLIYYPNFYKRVIPDAETIELDAKGNKKLPEARGATFWNGGLRPIYEQIYLALRHLPSQTSKKALADFEKKVSNLELVIQKKVLQQTYSAMTRDMSESKTVHELFRVQGGFQRVSQKDLFKVKGTSRAYFAEYYNLVSEETTRMVLEELIKKSNPDLEVPENLSRRKLKKLATEAIKDYGISDEDIEKLTFNASVKTNAASKAKSRSLAAEKHVLWHMAKSLASLWNFNMVNTLASTPVVKRIQIANLQMKDPLAKARAVRATKAMLVIDKPMELALTYYLLANIDQGLATPMTDEKHGPNSWNYLGSYIAINAAVGLAMGFHGGVWLKLVQDFRQSADFGKAPEGLDAKKSFLRYLYKKTMKTPKNSLWEVHKENAAIIWANMPAGLATYVTMYTLSTGRVDVDLLSMGYLLSFTLPHYSSLGYKVDQGFEGAAFYDLHHIPLEYRQHPAVQLALNEVIYKRRKTFQIWNNLFFNIYGIFWEKLQTLNVAGIGPRSLSRVFFGGDMLAERISNGVYHTTEGVKNLTGLDLHKTSEKCVQLILKNNTEAIHSIYKPKVGN